MFEAYSEILGLLVIFFGFIGAVAYYPQAAKMYKRKSSADISLLTYSIWLVTSIAWFFYGLAIHDFPLTSTGILNIIGSGIVIILYFAYKKVKK